MQSRTQLDATLTASVVLYDVTEFTFAATVHADGVRVGADVRVLVAGSLKRYLWTCWRGRTKTQMTIMECRFIRFLLRSFAYTLKRHLKLWHDGIAELNSLLTTNT